MSKIAKIYSERPVVENLQYQLFQLYDIQGPKLSFPIPAKIFLPMVGCCY